MGPMENGVMTVNDLIEKLQALGAGDLPIKISNYEGEHAYTAYTVRKHVVTDDEGEIVNAYAVING